MGKNSRIALFVIFSGALFQQSRPTAFLPGFLPNQRFIILKTPLFVMEKEDFERKCIVCGRKAEIEEFCSRCYINQNPIIKSFPDIAIKACPSCGRFLLERRWTEAEPSALISQLLAKKAKTDSKYCRVSFTGELNLPEHSPAPGTSAIGEIHARVSASSVESKHLAFSEEYSLPASVHYELCNDCKLQNSKYFEATIQIRRAEHETADGASAFEQIVSRIRKEAEQLSAKGLHISKEEKSPNGIDLMLTLNSYAIQIARRVASEFGAGLKINERLFSQTKSGERLYRMTALISAPNFLPGSVVAVDAGKGREELFTVIESGKVMQLEALMDGKRVSMQKYKMKRCGSLPRTTAQIVKTVPYIEVLSPENFQPAVPENASNKKLSEKAMNSKDGKTQIVIYEEKIYLA